ncbi:MAG: ABC transporter permease [Anaerolineae bacterium]|nr:ABC transporter permease [Anaerolineae bacterium]
MFNQILAIALKDLKVLLHDRGGMVSLFLMPVMFILVMSSAMDVEPISEDKPVEILAVNLDAGDLAGEVIAELDAVEGLAAITSMAGVVLTEERADSLISDGQYSFALIFPDDFSAQVEMAATQENVAEATVTFIVDPTVTEQFLASVRGAVHGFVQQQAAYAQMPLQLEAGFSEAAASAPAGMGGFVIEMGEVFIERMSASAQDAGESSLGVRFEQVVPSDYHVEEYPSAVEQNVPGYTLFGVFFIVQVLAMSLLQEKEEGTFRRLLAAPLSRTALMVGKLLPYYVVNLIQVASMFAIGYFVFDMNLGSSPLALTVVTLATAAAATGLGLLVAALGKTREQIGGLSTLLVLTLAAVGGMMVPTFVMPEFMQTLSKISPHSWALAGYQDVIVRGLGTAAVMNEVGVLLGFALVFFSIAVWRFRWE